MPTFEPDRWNAPGVKERNNCYNYACDRMPSASNGTRPRAQPGRANDITAGKPIGVGTRVITLKDGTQSTVVGIFKKFTHKGVRTAALTDGLLDIGGPPPSADCYRVGYYIRLPIGNKSGDFHWVREDGPGMWSHKPGAGNATDRQYNPKTRKYDGPKITAPDNGNTNLGPGYMFCGFLYVCPKRITIASLLPEDIYPDGEGVAVTLVADSMSLADTYPTNFRPEDITAEVNAMAARTGTEWLDGFGAGELLYQFDILSAPAVPGRFRLELAPFAMDAAARFDTTEVALPNPFALSAIPTGPRRSTTVFVSDTSITVSNGSDRFLPDPQGTAAARFTALLGLGGVDCDRRLPAIDLVPPQFARFDAVSVSRLPRMTGAALTAGG